MNVASAFRRMDEIVVVAAIIEENGAFLVTRRPDGVHLAGLWEFPGGKVDPAENHADALRREMREELDTDSSYTRRTPTRNEPSPCISTIARCINGRGRSSVRKCAG
jgi:8-oxo-dGTP pyrophosphatase MutT (NUDIX family)